MSYTGPGRYTCTPSFLPTVDAHITFRVSSCCLSNQCLLPCGTFLAFYSISHFPMENSQSSHISGNPSPSISTVSHNHKPKPEENVHEFINNALASMLGELAKPDGRPSITLKQRSKRGCYSVNPSSGALEAAGQDVHTTYSWPGKNVHEAWKFSMMLHQTNSISWY